MIVAPDTVELVMSPVRVRFTSEPSLVDASMDMELGIGVGVG